MPPVNSRMMVKLTPRHMFSLSGEMETRLSDAKLHGRRLPNVWSDLRRERRPCSGRTGPVPYFWKNMRQELSRGVEGFAYGPAYCAEKDCIGFFGGVERFVCEWGAGGIYRSLEDH